MQVHPSTVCVGTVFPKYSGGARRKIALRLMLRNMPFRMPRISEKASNDRYNNDKHHRWLIRCNAARLVLGLGVAVLLGTMISIAYGIHQWMTVDPEDDDTLGPLTWRQMSIIKDLNVDYETVVQARERRMRGENRRKRRSHGGGDDLPRCTPSPLENRKTSPKYGCAEVEVGME